MFIFTVGGRPRSMVGWSSRTPCTIERGLPPGVALMPMNTASCPLIMTEELVFSAPRSTVAMSCRCTRLPPPALTVICLNSSRLVSAVSGHVDDGEIALGLARRRLEVVGLDRRRHIGARDAARGHLQRVEPHPHGEG